jgi:hypothetical protein
MVLLTVLSGCFLKGALPTSLKNVDVAELRAELVDPSGACPGMAVPVLVTAVDSEGGQYSTSAEGEQHKVKWKNFDVVAGGAAFQDGLVVLPADPAALWNKSASVVVTSVHHHGLAASLTVPVRYDCSYTANYSGASGRDGADGQQGSSGEDGVDKQSSESYAEPGGHGGHGGRGGDGSDGEPGRDGDRVIAYVDVLTHPDGRELYLVVTESETTRNTQRFVVAAGSTVTVVAHGGHGGRGGHGGNGGSGGGGGTGKPPGNGGDGGDGGSGANGADGGHGGSVTVLLDPATKRLGGSPILVQNEGGYGGSAGNAGFGGSGGNSFSGADGGERGEDGVAGSRSGRNGEPGPKPRTDVQPLELSL